MTATYEVGYERHDECGLPWKVIDMLSSFAWMASCRREVDARAIVDALNAYVPS